MSRKRKHKPDEVLFDIDEIEKIEEEEAKSEPEEAEMETPDIRELSPKEVAALYHEYGKFINDEVCYRMSLYRNAHILIERNDLIHEGFLGLLHGARKYDKAKGASLQTYAGYWVRKYIRAAIKEALINYRYLDCQMNGETTSRLTRNTISEAEFTFENDYYRTNARLPVYDTNPERIVSERDKKLRVRYAVKNGTDRERKYIAYRYGFDGGDGHSWRDSRKYFRLHGKRGEHLEFETRYNTEQRLGYGFYDYAEEYWMPHDSAKTDFMGERYLSTTLARSMTSQSN